MTMTWKKPVLLITSVIILVLIGVFVFNAVEQREDDEMSRFMNGPYQSRLLYVQTCTIGNVGRELPYEIDTLQEEAEYCDSNNFSTSSIKAGYHVYDFNIRRSVYVGDNLMNILVENDILSFPSSFYRPVESGGNKSNTIVPLDDFTDFSISCNDNGGDFKCVIGDELYTFDQPLGLGLILPQGMVQGPEWDTLLESRFFPSS